MTDLDGPTAEDLTVRVHGLLTGTIETCKAIGRNDLAAMVGRECQRKPRRRPIVVVAGEAKRGKSSLVNALLGWPELSPTGDTAVTGTYVVMSHGVAPKATVVAETGVGNVSRITVGVDTVDEWVSVTKNPANAKRVAQVEVRLPVDLLRSLTLVDTPGVGGLDSAHGLCAVRAVDQADALVFVVDAGAPISRSALDFLSLAARRIDSVVVVVTKTDAYQGWKQIVEDDRRLLRQYAPALGNCPVVAVSAALAFRALGADPALATRLQQRSGLDELREVLAERVAARQASLPLANTMQVVAHSMAEIEPLILDELSIVEGDPAVRHRLEVEERRLADLEADSAKWRNDLSNGIDHIRVSYQQNDLVAALANLRRSYESRIEGAKRAELEALPDALLGDLVQLSAQLADGVAGRLGDLAIELMGEIDAESMLRARLAALSSTVFDHQAHAVDRVGRPELTRVEKLSSLVSFSSGRAIGSLGATLPIVGLIGLPVAGVGLGVGVLFSVLMTKGRKDINLQANSKKWLSDQLEEARRTMSEAFSHQMIDVQTELRDSLNVHIKQQRASATALRDAANRLLHEDRAAREADRRVVERRAERLRLIRRGAAQVLALCGSDRHDAGLVGADR